MKLGVAGRIDGILEAEVVPWDVDRMWSRMNIEEQMLLENFVRFLVYRVNERATRESIIVTPLADASGAAGEAVCDLPEDGREVHSGGPEAATRKGNRRRKKKSGGGAEGSQYAASDGAG